MRRGFRQPSFLTGQIDIRGFSKTHAVDVTCKSFVAKSQPKLNGADIRRLLHDLFDRQKAEWLVVVNRPAKYDNRTHLAIDDVCGSCHTFFNSRCHGYNLECRTRLVGLTDGTITPGLGGVARVLIRIEGRIIRHPEDLTRGRRHGDDRDSFWPRLDCGSHNLFFENVLNIFVDCRDEIRSGRRRLFEAVETSAAGISQNNRPAGLTANASVVPVFQSPHTFFINIHIA